MTHHVDLDAVVLQRRKHDRREEGVDVMEAVAWYAGEEHSDHPRCASDVVAAGMRSWNDDLPDDARQQLKAYIPLLPGTNATEDVELTRAWMALDGLVREHTPTWLREVGTRLQEADAVDVADRLAAAAPVRDTASADAVFPLLTEALGQATRLWDGRNWAEARAAIGASGGVALWRVVDESRAAESKAIDAARAASGQASGAAAVAGADLDLIVAKLQASTHELFRRMIATTSAATPSKPPGGAAAVRRG
jgi:hypothetical protein